MRRWETGGERGKHRKGGKVSEAWQEWERWSRRQTFKGEHSRIQTPRSHLLTCQVHFHLKCLLKHHEEVFSGWYAHRNDWRVPRDPQAVQLLYYGVCKCREGIKERHSTHPLCRVKSKMIITSHSAILRSEQDLNTMMSPYSVHVRLIAPASSKY